MVIPMKTEILIKLTTGDQLRRTVHKFPSRVPANRRIIRNRGMAFLILTVKLDLFNRVACSRRIFRIFLIELFIAPSHATRRSLLRRNETARTVI